MTSGLIVSSKNKAKLFAKKLKKTSDININNYKNYKRVYNSLCRKTQQTYTLNLFDMHKTDIKATWRIIKSTIGRQVKKGLNHQKNKENYTIFNDPNSIANGFNDFFLQILDPHLAQKYPTQTSPLRNS